MLKSKAIDILRSLSGEEFKKFGSFVESPYFNSNKGIIRLVSELKKYYPLFSHENLTEEFLYNKIYKTNRYSYSVMRNLMSELLYLSESFLLNNRLNNTLFSKHDNIIHLLDELQERGLDKLYNIRLTNLKKHLSKEKYDDTYFRHQIAVLNLILDDEYNKVTFKNSLNDIFFKKALFELCNIANSLYRNANSIYFSSMEINVDAEESCFFTFLKCIDIDRFLKEMKKFKSNELFIIDIYLKLVVLILNPENKKNYFEVKTLIFQNIKKFTNKEKYSLLNILRNYVMFSGIDNKNTISTERKSINLEMLDTIDFNKDKLESILGIIYIGVFLEAITKKDYRFAEEFAVKYSGQLRKEIRKDVTGFTSAYIHFIKANYEKALEVLSLVKPLNKVYFIHVKNLYLKIYYELGYYDEGLSLIDSYKHYLDKILNKFVKKNITNVTGYYLRLYRLKFNKDRYSEFDVVQLIKDIDSEKLNIESKWLLAKAQELKKLF
ncbi:MAG: hypothetical protein IPL53_24535 [Ignavibacteria bacterium]|nr:hypothetical protein [Ignavibacteria bacterium]